MSAEFASFCALDYAGRPPLIGRSSLQIAVNVADDRSIASIIRRSFLAAAYSFHAGVSDRLRV
jgi:hypothetical protein